MVPSSQAAALDSMALQRRRYKLRARPTHLARAGHWERLRQELTDFAFLQAKVAEYGPQALIEDYQYSDAAELRCIQEALQREAHVLSERPELLWQQLYNQLQWHGAVLAPILEPELARRRAVGSVPWLRSQMPNKASLSLIRTLAGHQGDVTVCTFSLDGRLLVSGDAHGGLRIWDTQTGLEHVTLPGHPAAIAACALRPDGVTLVSVSNDRSSRATPKSGVSVWDIPTQSEHSSLPVPSDGFEECVLSADASTVATVKSESVLKVWDVDTGCLRATLRGRDKYLSFFLASADGTLIISGDNTGQCTSWDTHTGQQRATWQGPTGRSDVHVLSDDGRLLITGGAENTVAVWDTQAGQPLTTLYGHRRPITTCAVSPTGDFVVSGSEDRTIRIWDTATGMLHTTLHGHLSKVKRCLISPQSDFIVSYAADGTVKIWDISTAKVRATLRGHAPLQDKEQPDHLVRSPGTGFQATTLGDSDDTITACAISPKGDFVVSAGRDRTLKVWDAVTGQLRATLSGHQDEVNACAVSPTGDLIVSASDDKTLKVWDSRTGQLLSTLEGHTDRVTNCAISLDGVLIASTSRDNTLRVWDRHTGEVRVSAATESNTYSDTIFSRDMRLLVTEGSEYLVTVWDITARQPRFTLPGHNDFINDLALSRDGAHLVSASSDHTLGLWDLCAGRLCTILTGHEKEVRKCALSPDGRFIVSAGADGTLRFWDTCTGQERARHDGFDSTHTRLAISPDGAFVVASAGHEPSLRVYDAATGEQRSVLQGHTGSITCCAVSRDGAYIVSGSQDTTLRVWETRTGQERMALRGHGGAITTCAISPDGHLIASGSADGTVRLWRPDAIMDERAKAAHTNRVVSCVFSPDGQFAVSGSHDGTVCIWDPETGRERNKLEVHEDLLIDHVLISPDSTRIVICSSNADGGLDIQDRGTLDVWESRTGSRMAHIEAHAGRINAAAFSRDGGLLVTASTDKTLKIWDVHQGQERHRLCGHTAGVVTCAFSPDDTFVFSAADDRALRLWDARTGQERTVLDGRAFVVDASGEYFLVSSDYTSFTVWNIYAGRESALLVGQGGSEIHLTLHMPATMHVNLRGVDPRGSLSGFAQPPVECLVSPGGTLAIATSRERVVTVGDTQTGHVRVASGGRALALSPDGRYVAIGGGSMLAVLDLRRLRLTVTPMLAPPTCAAFHVQHPQIICGDEAGNVYLFHLEGIEYGPSVVTALDQGGSLTVRCPGCMQGIPIATTDLGQEVICSAPQCGVHMHVNDWCVPVGHHPSLDLTPSVAPWLVATIVASPEKLTEWGWSQPGHTRQCQAKENCGVHAPFSARPVLWIGETVKHVTVECYFCHQTICSGCARKVLRRVQVEALDFLCWQLCCPICLVGLGNEFRREFVLYSASTGVIGGIQARSTPLPGGAQGTLGRGNTL